MNWRRFLLCCALVFLAQALVAGSLHMVLEPLFEDPVLFRPEGQEKLVPYMVSRVLFVGLFVYIYSRWPARRGWSAGLQYGSIIWLFYSIPMTVGFWSFMRMPDGLALGWVGIGLIEYLAGGLLLGLLWDPQAYTPTASAGTIWAP